MEKRESRGIQEAGASTDDRGVDDGGDGVASLLDRRELPSSATGEESATSAANDEGTGGGGRSDS